MLKVKIILVYCSEVDHCVLLYVPLLWYLQTFLQLVERGQYLVDTEVESMAL